MQHLPGCRAPPKPLAGFAVQATAAANMPQTLNPLIVDYGAGDYTLEQLQVNGYIDATQRAGIEGGLQMMGLSQPQIDAMNLTMIHGAYTQASPEFQQKAAQLSSVSQTLAGTADQLGDKEVDTEQTGAGFYSNDWCKTFLPLKI